MLDWRAGVETSLEPMRGDGGEPAASATVLVVEHNAADARRLQVALAYGVAEQYDVLWADCLATALERLATNHVDLILLDLALPDGHGMESVVETLAAAPKVAVIVLADAPDEELERQSLRIGAQDYLFKGEITRRVIGRAARYAIERKRMLIARDENEGALRCLVSELENVSRLKADFVTTMSHELRTPLTAIIGYTELLLADAFGVLSTHQVSALRRVNANSQQLLVLIQATLDLGKVEKGQLRLEPETVDVAALIAEIAGETRPLCERPSVVFTTRVTRPLPPLATDPAKLTVVVKSLLANAVKFTTVGEVALGAVARDDGVEISVTDTGIGIAPEMLPVIFEPFRQLEPGLTRRHGGVGLGLYIVRRLLDVIGGQIAVESEPGKGSTFRLWLPSQLDGASDCRVYPVSASGPRPVADSGNGRG